MHLGRRSCGRPLEELQSAPSRRRTRGGQGPLSDAALRKTKVRGWAADAAAPPHRPFLLTPRYFFIYKTASTWTSLLELFSASARHPAGADAIFRCARAVDEPLSSCSLCLVAAAEFPAPEAECWLKTLRHTRTNIRRWGFVVPPMAVGRTCVCVCDYVRCRGCFCCLFCHAPSRSSLCMSLYLNVWLLPNVDDRPQRFARSIDKLCVNWANW